MEPIDLLISNTTRSNIYAMYDNNRIIILDCLSYIFSIKFKL